MTFEGAVLAILQTAKRHPSKYALALRHLGTAGLFFVAILDSSPLPTFGGLDVLTAILAARAREPWYLYAIVATLGSMVGAYITYRLARKAGAGYLHRKFGERRVSSLLRCFEKWGTGALVISAAVPLPLPTSAFFAAAGALNYPLKKFLTGVTVSRAARYSAVAAVGAHYGRHFVRMLRHPGQYYGWLILLTLIVAGVTFATFAVLKRMNETDGKLEQRLPVGMD